MRFFVLALIVLASVVWAEDNSVLNDRAINDALGLSVDDDAEAQGRHHEANRLIRYILEQYKRVLVEKKYDPVDRKLNILGLNLRNQLIGLSDVLRDSDFNLDLDGKQGRTVQGSLLLNNVTRKYSYRVGNKEGYLSFTVPLVKFDAEFLFNKNVKKVQLVKLETTFRDDVEVRDQNLGPLGHLLAKLKQRFLIQFRQQVQQLDDLIGRLFANVVFVNVAYPKFDDE